MQAQPLIPVLRRIFAPPYQDYMGLAVGHARSSVPAPDLFAKGRVGAFLEVCASRYRAPDLRGVASHWAQRYVLALERPSAANDV